MLMLPPTLTLVQGLDSKVTAVAAAKVDVVVVVEGAMITVEAIGLVAAMRYWPVAVMFGYAPRREIAETVRPAW